MSLSLCAGLLLEKMEAFLKDEYLKVESYESGPAVLFGQEDHVALG